MLVNPVEKDTSISLSCVVSNGLFSSNHWRASFNCLCITLHLGFAKVSVEWGMLVYTFLHVFIDIRELAEGEHPALVARITASHPPSAQSTF